MNNGKKLQSVLTGDLLCNAKCNGFKWEESLFKIFLGIRTRIKDCLNANSIDPLTIYFFFFSGWLSKLGRLIDGLKLQMSWARKVYIEQGNNAVKDGIIILILILIGKNFKNAIILGNLGMMTKI